MLDLNGVEEHVTRGGKIVDEVGDIGNGDENVISHFGGKHQYFMVIDEKEEKEFLASQINSQ